MIGLRQFAFFLGLTFFGLPAFTGNAGKNSGNFLAEESLVKVWGDRKGALVLIDCASGKTQRLNAPGCAEKWAPCSTFKIWNSLIGLETGLLLSADQDFYRWDGQKRFLPDWNQDLTLKQAFQYSCVPAYQDLARKIGQERMDLWLKKIAYGNLDTSSGLDVFWLPSPGRRTIMISPDEQAALMLKLVKGKLPFSEKSREILKEIMTVKQTEQGILYGKTGTGSNAAGKYNLGWFVGYVEGGGQTIVFACLLHGEGASGKEARALVEKLLLAE